MFSVMLKIAPCSLRRPFSCVCIEIAVAIAVPIENPVHCEVRGVIRFHKADEILGYLLRGIVLLLGNAGPHTARQTQVLLRE